jgi:DNA helicase-2/ATP-dependent DNA helicase PcrA
MGGYSPRRAPSKIGIDASSFLKNVNIGRVITKENNNGSDVKVGDKVRHKKFGVGMVLSLIEDSDMKVAEIKFETAGMKRLIITGTTLEIIG